MFQLEVVNELFLKATCVDGRGELFTKAGAMVGHQGQNKFDKILLGPQGNPVQAIAGQILRRVTGENLPLMRCMSGAGSISYYADDERHVTVISLNPGDRLMVESEDLLAFNELCSYSSKFLAQGVISQKGLFTTVLTGKAPGAQVAILTSGNPFVMQSPCCADPDAVVAWTGMDPGFKLDVSFKTILGRSGESYQFEWNQPGCYVVIQPKERQSGLDVGIDGHSPGHQPQMQQNQSFGDAFGTAGNTMSDIGNALGRIFR